MSASIRPLHRTVFVILLALAASEAKVAAEPGRAKLTASGGAAGDLFGSSVAIDGDVIVVGTSGIDVGGNTDQGAAFVYRKPAGGWSGRLVEVARLTSSDAKSFDRLNHVAIDGNVIVVGAETADIGENRDQGAAYVFVKPPGGWAGQLTESAKLFASDGEFMDNFGSAVAISGDTIVVGAFADDIGPNLRQGSAYVFVEPSGGWAGPLTETAKLVASDGEAHDNSGLSVGIDGDTAVLGSPQHTVDTGFFGAVYVFVEPAGGWGGELTETAKLAASDPTDGALLGISVSISTDTVVAGAFGDEVGGNVQQGSAYVFVEPAGGWAGTLNERAKLTASDGQAQDFFGVSVAIDAGAIVAGAYNDALEGNLGQGSAYLFFEPHDGWGRDHTEAKKLTAPDGMTNDLFGVSVALDDRTAICGATGDDIGANVDQGSAYVFSRRHE